MRNPTPDIVATGYAAGFYAGFWRRLGAYLVDLLVLALIGSILDTLLELVDFPDIFAILAYAALLYGYHIHLIYKYGATPGKMALNLQVANLHGKGLTRKQAWLRISPYIVLNTALPLLTMLGMALLASPESGSGEIIGSVALMIGYGVILLLWYLVSISVLVRNPYKRTLHDLIAGTVVVYNPPQHVAVTQIQRPE